MNQSNFQKLLDKYLQGKCTPEEEKLVADWFDKIAVDKTKQQEVPASMIERRIWNNIQHKVSGTHPSAADIKAASRMEKKGWYYSAAAAMLLLISFSVLFLLLNRDPRATYFEDTDALVEYTNELNQPQTLKLEDGSEIMLQPKSTVSYKNKFDASKREVYLTGEAFFKIAKDASRPFYVYTEGVTTKVLGTSFLVKAYDHEEEVSVVVRTGKVSVYTLDLQAAGKAEKSEKEIILTPNQQVVINKVKENVERKLIENPEVISEDIAVQKVEYQEAAVADILAAIEESYGIDIRYNKAKMASCKLTTSFTDEGLYERLEIISTAINATYKKTDQYIFIVSDGCKN